MPLITPERSEKIAQMPPAKHEAVLSAAMAAWCAGYKPVSAEALAAAAGISKSLLFHYFGSKHELLHHTALTAAEIVQRDFFDQVNFQESDLFRRLWRITTVRFDVMARYPAIFAFLARLAGVRDPGFEAAREALLLRAPDVFPLREEAWYEGVNAALFRPGLDVRRAVNTVRWTFAGYAAAMPRPWETGEDPEAVHQRALQELWEYISFFRKQYYA